MLNSTMHTSSTSNTTTTAPPVNPNDPDFDPNHPDFPGFPSGEDPWFVGPVVIRCCTEDVERLEEQLSEHGPFKDPKLNILLNASLGAVGALIIGLLLVLLRRRLRHRRRQPLLTAAAPGTRCDAEVQIDTDDLNSHWRHLAFSPLELERRVAFAPAVPAWDVMHVRDEPSTVRVDAQQQQAEEHEQAGAADVEHGRI